MNTSSLFASFMVSLVGFGMFRYGRSTHKAPPLIGGVALMGFPYFVSSVAATLGIACGILALTWATSRYLA